MFDKEGHVLATPAELLNAVDANRDHAVKELGLTGTPRAFDTFREYRAFVEDVGLRLGVHPHMIVVRGSAHFGFSITPKSEKIWQPFRYHGVGLRKPSDIDVAIVDFRYFTRVDEEIRAWESQQTRPKPTAPAARHWLRRAKLRAYGICADGDALPPNTCVAHVNAMAALSATAFCRGTMRKVTAFAYRDWWCLHNKCAFDLGQVRDLVAKGALLAPEVTAAAPKSCDFGRFGFWARELFRR